MFDVLDALDIHGGGIGVADMQHNCHLVAIRKCEIDQLTTDHQLPAANLVEHGFQHMREIGDIGQAEHTAGALQGMYRPEQAVDRITVFRVFLDEEDNSLDFGEQLVCLHPKRLLVQVGRIHSS